jgi:UDP-glucose 4-epimerase
MVASTSREDAGLNISISSRQSNFHIKKMSNILITGASGFIGSFLVEEGLRRDYQVYAGIRKSSSKEYLKDPGIRFVEFDFSSIDRIVSTLSELKKQNIRFHYIIHSAGLTKAQKKADYSRVNYLNTKNFIEALQQADMVPDKFIFISSLAAFGPGNPQTLDPVKLSDKPNPIELYGKSKLEAETYIQSLETFPWLIFRPTGVYGPREKDYFVFFQTIRRGIETYIGRSKQILTFIYVKDLVRVIFDAISSPIIRKAYFVSDGNEYDTVSFASITKKHLNQRTIRLFVPPTVVKSIALLLEKSYGVFGKIPTLNTDKYKVMSSTNWKCEVDPLQNDFNFKAQYDLDKGVKETLDWYIKEGWL